MATDQLEPTDVSRLYQLARTLTGALSAKDVVEAVFEHARVELGASAVGLWLMESGAISFTGGTGQAHEYGSQIRFIPADSDLPAAAVLRNREILTYESVEERNRRWPELTDIESYAEGTAILPLLVGDRPLGCIHIGFPKRVSAAEFDLAFLDRLAQLTTAALDRALVYDTERERQAFLLAASAAVVGADDFEETLRRLAAFAVPRLADVCSINLLEGGEIRRAAVVHADPALADLVAHLGEGHGDWGPLHPTRIAMTERRTVWGSEIPDQLLRDAIPNDHAFGIFQQLRLTSYMSVPLISGGELLGVMTLGSAGSGRRFESNLTLAEDLASQVVDVLVSSRRRQRERDFTHLLQRLLLPEHLPELPGLEAASRYFTATPDAEAGGDFYDLSVIGESRVGFVIGDVEGHDAAAAVIMGQLRSATRALAGQDHGPGALVDALRRSWDVLGFTRGATGIFGLLDTESGEVVLASAGHPPPVVVSGAGRARLLELDAAPLFGAGAGSAIETRITLPPGDVLFLYTDGLIEEPGVPIDESLAQLTRSLDGQGPVAPDELCNRIVAAHARSNGRLDDIAILALRRRPAS